MLLGQSRCNDSYATGSAQSCEQSNGRMGGCQGLASFAGGVCLCELCYRLVSHNMQLPGNTIRLNVKACQVLRKSPLLQQQRLLPLLCQTLPKQQASDDRPKLVLACRDDLHSTCGIWHQVMSQRLQSKARRDTNALQAGGLPSEVMQLVELAACTAL